MGFSPPTQLVGYDKWSASLRSYNHQEHAVHVGFNLIFYCGGKTFFRDIIPNFCFLQKKKGKRLGTAGPSSQCSLQYLIWKMHGHTDKGYSPPHHSLSCQRCWSDEHNGSRPSASAWQSCWPRSSPGEEKEVHSIRNHLQIEDWGLTAPVSAWFWWILTNWVDWIWVLKQVWPLWFGKVGAVTQWLISLTYCPPLPGSLSPLIITPVRSLKCCLYLAVGLWLACYACIEKGSQMRGERLS